MHMICFLTSRIDNLETGKLNEANGFVEELRQRFPFPCRALHICSNPEGHEYMDQIAALVRECFEKSGFEFESYCILDGRNADQAAKLVHESNFIILTGGHVPTQNKFFKEIRLRTLIKKFKGVVIGISAGSMNSAEVVYAQPEEEGEAIDPAYKRFLKGLGLTTTMLLPHYQENKDDMLDGLKIYDEIACPDSQGKAFYAIPDGSYLYIDAAGKEWLRGEAYKIRNGKMTKISSENDVVRLYATGFCDKFGVSNAIKQLNDFTMKYEAAVIPFSADGYLEEFFDFYKMKRRDHGVTRFSRSLEKTLKSYGGDDCAGPITREIKKTFGLPLDVKVFVNSTYSLHEFEDGDNLTPFFFVFDIVFCEYENFTLCLIFGSNA